jgi:hypothetical protein
MKIQLFGISEQLALEEYEKFSAQRKAWEAKHADKQDEDELKKLSCESG